VDSLGAAVDDYIEMWRRHASRELEYFRRVPRTDEDAVRRAALAQTPSGKRFDHQRRIPAALLEQSAQRLVEELPRLRKAASFDELFRLINDLIRPIPGIGELVVYDTSLRIGARFGLEPEKVYLHAGTRDGAVALGFDGERQAIEMHELPETISQRL
jgi:hypothetical protein